MTPKPLKPLKPLKLYIDRADVEVLRAGLDRSESGAVLVTLTPARVQTFQKTDMRVTRIDRNR